MCAQLQIYEIASPSHGLQEHFQKCNELSQLHVPAVFVVFGERARWDAMRCDAWHTGNPVPSSSSSFLSFLSLSLFAGSVNHLLLVVNSSLNFVIYCCLAKRFRRALVGMVRAPFAR